MEPSHGLVFWVSPPSPRSPMPGFLTCTGKWGVVHGRGGQLDLSSAGHGYGLFSVEKDERLAGNIVGHFDCTESDSASPKPPCPVTPKCQVE